jgi:hypothetical protein
VAKRRTPEATKPAHRPRKARALLRAAAATGRYHLSTLALGDARRGPSCADIASALRSPISMKADRDRWLVAARDLDGRHVLLSVTIRGDVVIVLDVTIR